MRLGSLSGYDERDGCLLDEQEVGPTHLAGMGKAMAIGAEDQAVLDGVLSTLPFGNDVMSVARSLGPAAPHTGVAVPAIERLVPGMALTIDRALGDDIAGASVPSAPAKNLPPDLCAMSRLRVAGQSGLMASHEAARSSLGVEGWYGRAASAGARSHLHNSKYSTLYPKYLTELGNAVCVPVAEWIGRRIMEYGQRKGAS